MKKFILFAIGTVMTSTALAVPPPPPPPPKVGEATVTVTLKIDERTRNSYRNVVECTATGKVYLYDSERMDASWYGQGLSGCPQEITINGKTVQLYVSGSGGSKNGKIGAQALVIGYRNDAKAPCEFCAVPLVISQTGDALVTGDASAVAFSLSRSSNVRMDNLADRLLIESKATVNF